jgi:hypothetical protein
MAQPRLQLNLSDNFWRFAQIPLLMALVLTRLYLTGDRDIIARDNPHDQYWYIKTALHLFSGGRYDQMALAHLPVYAGWLFTGHQLGIPGRLMIDSGWILASVYLSWT